MSESKFSKLWKTEDWWSVWLGLGIVLLALFTFWAGSTIKGWVVVPAKLTEFSKVWADLAKNASGYLIIFILFGAVFSVSMSIMGHKLKQFIPGFIILFVGSMIIFYLAGWKLMEDLNMEAPLIALIVGLVISNVMKIPDWMKVSLRTEYYIKTGIVLLGATLPLTMIITAGPVAMLQATIVSIATWLTIYLAATRIFKLEPKFGAVLGAGGAVCGVSASIAVGGAVQSKNEHISISIAVVTVWAIVMIFILSFVMKQIVPGTISPGVAGAIVGTSEFADAAGFAVAAELAARFGEAPIHTFTLMKVIGRDIWIGIWALILSVISVMYWETSEGEKKSKVGGGIIWERFPKFVLGFLAASLIMSAVSTMVPANYLGKAGIEGKYKDKEYKADFSQYQMPPQYADRIKVDTEKKVLTVNGQLNDEDLKALTAGTTPEQAIVFKQLVANSNWFNKVLNPDVITPIKKLRSWAFVFCFLCIGLSTRFAELAHFGLKPFWAFTVGVIVNVPLGIVLSAVTFKDYWMKIG
ncbi:MAG TPA: putative sulfate exporter family transporter [Syntrophales bacterium]|nr:putative sulfate exporter family transporter [Syntrophales bacterium]